MSDFVVLWRTANNTLWLQFPANLAAVAAVRLDQPIQCVYGRTDQYTEFYGMMSRRALRMELLQASSGA